MKEIYGFENFGEYLEKLKNKKPFDCPLLKVLPRDIRYFGDGGNEGYKKGSLICSATPGSVGTGGLTDHLCHFNEGGIKLNEKGELEAKCGWNYSKFKLEIKGFEPAKKD